MNINLTGLYINAFRDIGVDQTVDIPKNTLVGVGGKNEDAGGSNGSGKTSLILADKVALFGPRFVDLTAQDCKNRHLDEVTQITAKLDVDDKKVQVSRTIGGKLILVVDDVLTEGKVEDIQPRIESILSISSEYLSYLTYKAQGDYGGFIKMKDSDKKQFLSQFFNLEKIEKAGAKVDEKLKANSNRLIEAKAKLESLRQNIALLDQDVKNVTDILNSKDFTDKVEKVVADKKTLEATQYQLVQVREAIKNYKAPEPPNEMVTRKNVAGARCLEIDNMIQISNKASSELASIATQLIDMRSKVGHAKEGRCYACNQPVISAEADKVISSNTKRMEDMVVKANNLKKSIVDVDALKADRYKSEMEYNTVSDEISNFKARNNMSDLRSKESSLSITASSIKNSIDSDEKYIGFLKKQLTDAKNQNQKASAEFVGLEAGISMATLEKEVLEQTSKILSRSGFLGYIFDSVLDEINYESNLNLQMIPNVRHLRVYFSPDRAIKTTGATSKEITCSIYDGSNAVSFKGLSGGEQRSVSIAVDEAIDTILQRRLGVNVGWKFLDEPFDAIDNSSKEALLEFFRLKSASKTYLIVDHSSEFNAAVDKRITVTKRNGIAKIDV